MSIDHLIPNRPKQKRSIERFEKILNTVEEMLIKNGLHALTIQEIAIKAKMKRSSLYKLFPSTASIFYALSERHTEKFNSLYINNTECASLLTTTWYFNVFIDLISIYLNQNKASAVLFFYLESLPLLKTTDQQNKRLLASVVLQTLSSKGIDIPSEKVYIASQLCLATFSVGYGEENHISPRYVAEAKKAVLAYLTSA
tara:strand:- start:183 stop:779 length:597 start_codon:yes stop_codon:yes gene_type:complete